MKRGRSCMRRGRSCMTRRGMCCRKGMSYRRGMSYRSLFDGGGCGHGGDGEHQQEEQALTQQVGGEPELYP